VSILHAVIQLYVVVIFARIILSWFPVTSGSALATVSGFIYSITEPVLGPVRRALPPLSVGSVGFDLSPIIVLIGLQVLASIL
jgi:YggT family protein